MSDRESLAEDRFLRDSLTNLVNDILPEVGEHGRRELVEDFFSLVADLRTIPDEDTRMERIRGVIVGEKYRTLRYRLEDKMNEICGGSVPPGLFIFGRPIEVSKNRYEAYVMSGLPDVFATKISPIEIIEDRARVHVYVGAYHTNLLRNLCYLGKQIGSLPLNFHYMLGEETLGLLSIPPVEYFSIWREMLPAAMHTILDTNGLTIHRLSRRKYGMVSSTRIYKKVGAFFTEQERIVAEKIAQALCLTKEIDEEREGDIDEQMNRAVGIIVTMWDTIAGKLHLDRGVISPDFDTIFSRFHCSKSDFDIFGLHEDSTFGFAEAGPEMEYSLRESGSSPVEFLLKCTWLKIMTAKLQFLDFQPRPIQ